MQTEMLKTVKRTITERVPLGLWLVVFHAVWGNRCNPGAHDDCSLHGCMDNGAEYVADVDSDLDKVTERNYFKLRESVVNRDASWNATGSYGDTHDLRPRLFKTRKEAQAYIKATLERFKNPQPWESFVRFE